MKGDCSLHTPHSCVGLPHRGYYTQGTTGHHGTGAHTPCSDDSCEHGDATIKTLRPECGRCLSLVVFDERSRNKITIVGVVMMGMLLEDLMLSNTKVTSVSMARSRLGSGPLSLTRVVEAL
jgi:hypothetical protein